MEFHGIKLLPIDMLGLSQLYLSSEKLAGVESWFNPHCMDNFEPLPVHDFGNNVYTLTDGHTRAYVAYKNGVQTLPIVYDHDEIVAGETGQLLYKADIEWCKRFRLTHIRHLENRILSHDLYKKLWQERCERSYHLLTQTSDKERAKMQNLAQDLFLYGTSADLSELFFESKSGELYLYKNNALIGEN